MGRTKSTIPSEQAAQPHWQERCQQEVGDSVEVERREGHHGNSQGKGTPGGQVKEFTAKDQETGVKIKDGGRTIERWCLKVCQSNPTCSPVSKCCN